MPYRGGQNSHEVTFLFLRTVFMTVNGTRILRQDTVITAKTKIGGRFCASRLCHMMLSSIYAASNLFISNLCQFSAFGICVLSTG